MDIPSISSDSFYSTLGATSAPLLIAARRDAASEADQTMVVGTVLDALSTWCRSLQAETHNGKQPA